MQRISGKAPRGSARVHSEKPNQMLSKFQIQYVSEGAFTLFFSVIFSRGCE